MEWLAEVLPYIITAILLLASIFFGAKYRKFKAKIASLADLFKEMSKAFDSKCECDVCKLLREWSKSVEREGRPLVPPERYTSGVS